MRIPSLALILYAATLSPLAAQATRDQARLMFNVSAGYNGGATLWRVTDQPLFDDRFGDPLIDSLHITRRVRPALTLGVKGIYFRGDNLGFFGEGYLIGVGFQDSCTRTSPTLSVRNEQVCGSVDQAEKSASAVQVSGGAIYRINSRKVISPYVRVGLGFVLSSQSAVRTTGRFANQDNQLVDVEIYPDDSETRLGGAATLALGMTAVIAPGYQIRWEVRDNIVGLRAVNGPTATDGAPPSTGVRYRHLLGIEVGFDVVLERRRGRRY